MRTRFRRSHTPGAEKATQLFRHHGVKPRVHPVRDLRAEAGQDEEHRDIIACYAFSIWPPTSQPRLAGDAFLGLSRHVLL